MVTVNIGKRIPTGTFGSVAVIVESVDITKEGSNSVRLDIEWRTDPTNGVPLFEWNVVVDGLSQAAVSELSTSRDTEFVVSGIPSQPEEVELIATGLGNRVPVADITSDVGSVLGDTPELSGPEFSVTSFRSEKSPVDVDAAQTLTASITNFGGSSGEQDVVIDVNGQVIYRVSPTIDVEETAEYGVTFVPENNGIGTGLATANISIGNMGVVASEQFDITSPDDTDPIQDEADISVDFVRAEMDTVSMSQTQEIVAQVFNGGRVSVGVNPTLEVDGTPVGTKTETLLPGETVQFVYQFSPSSAGLSTGVKTATVSTNGSSSSDSFSVVSDTQDTSPDEPTGGDSDTGLGGTSPKGFLQDNPTLVAGAAVGAGIALSQIVGGN